jgi:hypothetical protein
VAILGTNAKVEVQSVLATATTVTAVTLANPGVATSAAHGFSTGDVVVFTVAGGMVELDGQACRISAVATNTFTLENLDTSTFTAWTAGTCKKVTTFSTLSSAQNVTMPNPSPNKIDITTLIDTSKQYAFGLTDAPDGSITGLFNPGGTAEGLINTATNINGTLVFRLSFSGNTKHSVFNAYVSGGQGFDLQTNAAAQATISFTPVKQVIHYSS